MNLVLPDMSGPPTWWDALVLVLGAGSLLLGVRRWVRHG